MTPPEQIAAPSWLQDLYANAPHYRFFQAVRLLRLQRRALALPGPLRFRTPATLSFPASEIRALRPLPPAADDRAGALEMEVAFLGLTGPSGVLPVPYTELLQERRQLYRDSTLHAFLDLFNHRALSLFFDAWRKYRFWVDYEAGERDGFTRNLLDLTGVGASRLAEQLDAAEVELPQRFFTFFAGLLAQKPLPASNIEALVRGFFSVEVKLEQFVGQWMLIPGPEQSALGSQACSLGRDSFAGERIWDRQTKIRLEIGPLRRDSFARFLPGGAAEAALRSLLRFCLGHGLACEVTLLLHRDDLSTTQLSRAAPSRLGFDSWMRSRPALEHVADVRYCLLA